MELVTGEEGRKHTSDLSFFMQTLVWYIRLPGECYIQAKVKLLDAICVDRWHYKA